ncbi:MAG: hypothetical protein ABSG73_00925 [Candidatus Aminicenantales bacterium]|jgi:hypothetical protein
MDLSFVWHLRQPDNGKEVFDELFRACLRKAHRVAGTKEPS